MFWSLSAAKQCLEKQESPKIFSQTKSTDHYCHHYSGEFLSSTPLRHNRCHSWSSHQGPGTAHHPRRVSRTGRSPLTGKSHGTRRCPGWRSHPGRRTAGTPREWSSPSRSLTASGKDPELRSRDCQVHKSKKEKNRVWFRPCFEISQT